MPLTVTVTMVMLTVMMNVMMVIDVKEFEVSVLERQKRDLLALDLLAAHRDAFAQGRRKRTKKRKLDDDAEYEPVGGDVGPLPVVADGEAKEQDDDTPWKKTVGRRGSSRRLDEPSTPSSSTTTTTTTSTPSTPSSTPAKPRRGRGRPRLIKKEDETAPVAVAVTTTATSTATTADEDSSSSNATTFDDDMMKTED
jgi:hypothetical protein